MRKQLLALLLLVPALAYAGQDRQAIVLDSASQFAAQKAQVEAALADGETYAEIEAVKLAEVTGALNRIAAALADTKVSELTEQQRVAVFNDQELINQILTRASDDSRMVCRREVVVGSRMSTNICKSVAQRRRDREDSQQALKGMSRPTLNAGN